MKMIHASGEFQLDFAQAALSRAVCLRECQFRDQRASTVLRSHFKRQ